MNSVGYELKLYNQCNITETVRAKQVPLHIYVVCI
jgi:hypothetical protein